MTSTPGRPRRGSTLAVVAGAVFLISGVVLSLVGFVRLVTVLDGGGYGTSSMRMALVILAGAGACVATGIATLIWDVAKRYEQR